MSVGLTERVQREIETVHAFIAAWFRGDVAQGDDVFDEGLEGRLDAGLVNIQPSGQVLSRADLVEGIRGGYGRNTDFSIEISDVAVRWTNGEQVLVTYVEFQRGARNTVPADNRRISTVLFGGVQGGGRLDWLHIHETGI